MISYQYNHSKGFLEVFYTGVIVLEDLLEFGENIYSDASLPRNLYMITDATQAKYKITVSEFSTMFKSLKKHISAYELIKVAFIQSKPRETAISTLLSAQNPIPNYYHKVFSTWQAAENWLLFSKA
jgi:hypothetical protein